MTSKPESQTRQDGGVQAFVFSGGRASRQETSNKVSAIVTTLLVAGLVLLTLSLNLSRAVRADYNHDEDQFITSARLLLDEDLLPYRDYPYFHTPYLIYAYAGLFTITGSYHMLAARVFSALCASAAVLLVFRMVFYFFRSHPPRVRWLAAVAVLLFYLPNPLLAATAGFSWNHNLAVLFMLGSLWMVLLGSQKVRPGGWLLAGGALLGLAVGTRASSVTFLPGFIMAFLWFPRTLPGWHFSRTALFFGIGFSVALLPLAGSFISAPRQFIFGNLEYAWLNSIYRLAVPVRYDGSLPVFGPMNLVEKLGYLWNDIIGQPANLLLFMGLAYFGWAGLGRLIRRDKERKFEQVLVLAAAPWVALGSFLPTPAWYQYFYAPVPFSLLALALGLAHLTLRPAENRRWFYLLLILLVLLSNLFMLGDYRRMSFLRYVDLWKPVVIHQIGVDIQDRIGPSGKVFTLAPLYPLEGGLRVYPPLATGVFAFRIGSFLSQEQQYLYKIVSEQTIEAYLEADPPDGILVGFEPVLEQNVIAFAGSRGYQPQPLDPVLTLWIRPELVTTESK
jgi:4-amino-4-deoxy-L-arabinose transferase-like glycosyltransferase